MNLFIDDGAAPLNAVFTLRGEGSNGGAVVDSSTYARTVTGAAALSTTTFPHGATSIKFGASNSYAEMADSADFDLSNVPFTLRAWVYVETASSGNAQCICAQFGNTDEAFRLTYNRTSNFIVFTGHSLASGSTPVVSMSTGTGVALDTWMHIEVVREPGNHRLYVDGVERTSSSAGGTFAYNNSSNPMRLGLSTGLNQLTGYVKDAQLIVGTCLHPSGTTFTPPGAL